MQLHETTDDAGRVVFELSGTVPAPIERVWDMLADTQRLNQVVFGLPPLEIVDISAHGMQAQASVAGFTVRFVEHPWRFEAPHRYQSVRVFDDGPLDRLESGCELERAGDGTSVRYRVALLARGGPVGWAAEKIFRRRIEDGVKELQQLLEREPGAPVQASNPAAVEVRGRATPLGKQLGAHDARLVARLVDHVAEAPNDAVARIRPYALADAWGAERAAVLALCLDAVGVGLLQLRWDTLCPSCHGAVRSANSLAAVQADHAHCPVCDRAVDVVRTSNVEAVFSPAPAVRAASPDVYCLGSPRRTPHWLAQVVIEPGQVVPLSVVLGHGRYVVHAPGAPVSTLIDVGENGEERVRVTLEPRAGGPPALPAATPVVRAGKVSVVLKNECEAARRFQLANEGLGDFAATAAHVVDTAAWRRLPQAA